MKRNWHIAWIMVCLVMTFGSIHSQSVMSTEGAAEAEIKCVAFPTSVTPQITPSPEVDLASPHPHPQKTSTPQPPYLGGPGDGYASATTKTLITGPTETTPDIHLFPSPVRKGETAHLAVPNLHSKLEVLLQDPQGHILWRNTLWDTQDLAFMDIPTENLAAGTYLVEIRRDGHAVTRKLIVQSK
jgi:hypothetical protein